MTIVKKFAENEETDVRRENDDGRRENQSEYKQRVEYDYDSEDNATFVIPTDGKLETF